MKKNVTLVILIAVMAMALVLGACNRQTTGSKATITDGERAFAMMTVQNVFSKHAFYHQASKHCEELADIWVSEDGEYAESAHWILNGQELRQGIASIKKRYCTDHVAGLQNTLTALSKKVDGLEDIPENISAGAEYVMHTQETPVIEVAGDGKTAKMLCYSIGLSVQGSIGEDGTESKRSMWMWEKYAVDFVKENGEWKIWHLVNLHDEGPSESGSQGQGGMPPDGGRPGGTGGTGGQGGAPGGMPGGQDMAQGGAPGGMPGGDGGQGGAPGGMPGGQDMAQGGARGGMPGGGGAGGNIGDGEVREFFKYSATKPLKIDPPFPEPYYTFSETFSY